eukprot:1544008-Amphidinium_carterae.1
MTVVLEVDVDPTVLNPVTCCWVDEQVADAAAENIVTEIGKLGLDGWVLREFQHAVDIDPNV